jgi:hypothetical protein
MGFTETLVFYACIGAAIAAANYLSDDRHRGWRATFLLITALLFWPMYIPVLLSKRASREIVPTETDPTPAGDEMSLAIAQVEVELDAALSSLDGWAENALAGESDRLSELCHALRAQAARIREMDKLLEATAAAPIDKEPARPDTQPGDLAPEGSPAQEALLRWQKSRQGRAQNLTRLAQVRRQTHADLMATLAWIRELVSMIHLAKFTGAPASRAEELVAQIAAAVEGVSAIAWQEQDVGPDPGEAAAGHRDELSRDRFSSVRI